MRLSSKWLLGFFLAVLAGVLAHGQAIPDNASVSSRPVLDAAGPKQRVAIGAVYLISCGKDNIAGTGFLLDNGLIVTNHHVIGTCEAGDLLVISSSSKRVVIDQCVFDEDRDLALLKPTEKLSGGLQLARDDISPPGTSVSTWGYPFLYNGYYPLLSVGYIAGYRYIQQPNKKNIKHIVVNGAFNHGNSGGPLFVAQDNKVIGIVVLTYHFFPEYVETAIKTLQDPKGGGFSSGRFSWTDSSGHTTQLMDNQVIGMMLQEFYQKTQVMIGEAISVSELRGFLSEKRKELAPPIRPE
jgi:Trypsin-like peptidase domain